VKKIIGNNVALALRELTPATGSEDVEIYFLCRENRHEVRTSALREIAI